MKPIDPTSSRDALVRALAAFFGLMSLLAVIGRWSGGVERLELCWVDLRWLPGFVSLVLLGGCAVLWSAWAVRPDAEDWRRRWTAGVTVAMALAVGINFVVVMLWREGRVMTRVPLPLSALTLLALVWLARRVLRGGVDPVRSTLPEMGVFSALLAVAFPVLQFLTLGHGDYRRPAAAAIVLGARVYSDGRLSDAVADRVRSACELHHEGWVSELVMSGGPGDGAIHEVEAMRDAAIRAGVPAGAIRLDRDGWNTRATAANTTAMMRDRPGRLRAVSEFYHLPRIRLAYAREGVEISTVPARPQHLARWWPLCAMVREVPAWWLYYLRSLLPLPVPRTSTRGTMLQNPA